MPFVKRRGTNRTRGGLTVAADECKAARPAGITESVSHCRGCAVDEARSRPNEDEDRERREIQEFIRRLNAGEFLGPGPTITLQVCPPEDESLRWTPVQGTGESAELAPGFPTVDLKPTVKLRFTPGGSNVAPA